MAKPHQLKIACTGSQQVDLAEIHDLQGELKTLPKAEAAKLRRSLAKHGFIAPFFLWEDPADGAYYSIDGWQRRTVLSALQDEGWEIPPLPAIFVKAANAVDARRKLLQITSTYGKFSEQGVRTFLELAAVTIDTMAADFAIPIADMLVVADQFAKPEFTEIINRFADDEHTSPKDANWLICDFYGDDRRFAQVKKWLAPLMRTEHELDRDKLYKWLKDGGKPQ